MQIHRRKKPDFKFFRMKKPNGLKERIREDTMINALKDYSSYKKQFTLDDETLKKLSPDMEISEYIREMGKGKILETPIFKYWVE